MIIYCLGSSLYYLMKGGQGKPFVKALTLRVGLSLLLFVLLLFAYAMGWIKPHQL